MHNMNKDKVKLQKFFGSREMDGERNDIRQWKKTGKEKER